MYVHFLMYEKCYITDLALIMKKNKQVKKNQAVHTCSNVKEERHRFASMNVFVSTIIFFGYIFGIKSCTASIIECFSTK